MSRFRDSMAPNPREPPSRRHPDEESRHEIGTAWREEVADRLDDVLEGEVEVGSFEATRARFAAKYPAAAQ